ncbi:SOS response-associated peptidase family protein [Luteimonas fraxinea]|uniref:Abasic site processing protein n=1 Tax=Luteimonas fraxinea TaxID=2901869 RepID=A0ABS8UBS4_9GAMM|nr:SOS response-associated peptidase family protein [Luteimonas fraxinea]MCD9096684.1 SOS response-associated peptidase family protein [Luteimonas fraxinea]MCD9126054.1 SOS response-associated peptidase family protein [Luteimonas fraxinea]
MDRRRQAHHPEAVRRQPDLPRLVCAGPHRGRRQESGAAHALPLSSRRHGRVHRSHERRTRVRNLNARRDNLTRFWRNQFGSTHGLMIADTFYENVDDGKGGNKEIQFRPRTGEPMLVACLWSKWTDPKGIEPDLYSFAAVTDDPELEVAAAGHDRTIVNLKPENVEAWLTPQGRSVEELMGLLDDKRHPFYEVIQEAA